MCFRREDEWTRKSSKERRDDDLMWVLDEEPSAPERPVPVAESEPEERERAVERERVTAGVDG